MATGEPVQQGRNRHHVGHGWLLFLVCFAMLIVSHDQYIVVVALPAIGRALGYSAHTLQLVVSAYAVASSGFLLFGGRASDLLGRRRMLATGLVLYAVASLAGGLATGPAAQLTARVVQGLGGALVFPATLAVITTTYAQGRERNRAPGIWGAAGAAGLVVGVLAGGVLTRYLGWASVFFINVPLALAALALAFVVVPADPPRDQSRRFDLAGALTAMSSVTLVVWALVQGPELGWTSAPVTIPAVLGLLLGWAFTRIERRTRDPLMPSALLVGNPFVRLAVVLAFLFMATFGSLLYFVSIYLQNVLGYDALQTGLGFIAPTTIVLAASALAGPVSTRIGLRMTCLVALAIGAVGAVALAYAMTADARYVHLLPGLILVSLGDGAMFTAMFIAAATGVEPHRQGGRLRDRLHRIGHRGRGRSGAAGTAGQSRPGPPRRRSPTDRHRRRHPHRGVRHRRHDRRDARDRGRRLPPQPPHASRNPLRHARHPARLRPQRRPDLLNDRTRNEDRRRHRLRDAGQVSGLLHLGTPLPGSGSLSRPAVGGGTSGHASSNSRTRG
jgi:MFS family permease